MSQLSILFEDNHLLVVDKPAGIATMGSVAGVPTVARQAAEYLRQRYNKPGNVFVGVVSRLDRLVSGTLVLARTSKAARRLSEQIRQRAVDKRYLAMVEGKLEVSGCWRHVVDFVAKDDAAQRMKIVPQIKAGAQEARLRLRVLAASSRTSLLEVELLTGRKHQIRLQLSELGYPIVGDAKYGAQRKFSPGIALHCRRLTLVHPTLGKSMAFQSDVDVHWRKKMPSEFVAALPDAIDD